MKKSLVLLTLLTIFIGIQYTVSLANAPDTNLPANAFVVRVYYDHITDLQQLIDYDLWEHVHTDEKYALVSVDQALYKQLQDQGWHITIDYEETAQLYQADQWTFSDGYRTVSEIETYMMLSTSRHPDIVEIVDYGDSYCKIQPLGCITAGGQNLAGHDLLAYRITNRAIAGQKPVAFIMANIHARELTTPEITLRLADWFIDNYGTDADATWMVNYHEIWIVPIVNPDGHWLVELGTLSPYMGSPFTQRKNARPTATCQWPPQSFSQSGVDLNRNHSFAWGGASTNPCSLTYQGMAPASEPEIEALQNLVTTIIPDQKGPALDDPALPNTQGMFITLHSYGEWILWPWGHTTNLPAPNRTGLKAIGDKFATYNGYTSCQPGTDPGCLYTATGASEDWAYSELGIPAYTFELGTQFMPPYEEVDNQWLDNAPALIYAVQIASQPYQLALGPDTLNLTLDDTYQLTATINDSNNGHNPIARAEYYIDTPPWATTTRPTPFPLTPTDGIFNDPVETVTATIDTTSLSNTQHIIYVRGQDNAGNWGPITAIFLEPTSPPQTTYIPLLQR